MINKKSLWFLTLFSLILVLSIYYITMPSELLLTTNKNVPSLKEEKKNEKENNSNNKTEVKIEESDLLVSLRVESDEAMNKEIENLQEVLTNSKSSVEDKNKAYDKIKEINDNRSVEEKLESQIKDTFKLESFIKINNNQISVTVKSEEESDKLANNIMRTIQSNFNDSKYITVKFQK